METRSLISFLFAIFIGLGSAFPQGAVRVNNATGVVNDPSNFVPANSGTGANQFASGTDARITGAVQSAGGTLNSGTLAGVTGVSGTMSGNFTRSGTTSGGTLNSVSVVSGTAIDLDMSGTTTGNNVRFGTTTGGVYNTGTFSGVTRFTGTADLNGSFSGTGVIPGANLQASGTGNAGAITTGAQSIAGAKTFTDNITANGTANTMPNQTAASASSVMTRALVDDRSGISVWCINANTNTARADDAAWIVIPNGYNPTSTGMPASIPADMTRFRVRVSMGFTTNPSADTFPIYVRFFSQGINSTNTNESDSGTRVGVAGCYPDTTGGLSGTLTDLAASASGYANTFSFTSDWITIPSAWQTRAAAVGSYGFACIIVGNKSGGSLTDNFNQNHSIFGQIEFRR